MPFKNVGKTADGGTLNVAPVPQVKAWSFSAWQLYTDCPLKYKLARIDKIQEPASPVLDRGTGVHAIAEAFVGKVVPTKLDAAVQPYIAAVKAAAKGKLPAELKPLGDELLALRKAGASVEAEWAFDIDWNPTRWFGPTTWLRVKLDAHYEKEGVLKVIDHKTGRIYPEKGQLQLELYGLAGLLMYPAVEQVVAELLYHDQPPSEGTNPAQHIFIRRQISMLKRHWHQRTRAMFADRRFVPKPGNHCRWCFFRNSNKKNGGGQCKY